jgi:MerR family transcriptional regulator/heat shock protein HspR
MTIAEMHAEMAQLRSELESTRAVAARLAELRRSARTPDPRAALVPVRTSTRVTFWQTAPGQGDQDTNE